jgi:NAD(P)-dependent dehydrogenase (short-subunit alcohol dehydrogenase family)
VLEDKVAVITGSGSGIGRATALEMTRQGARVIVSDLNDDGGNETVELVRQAGGEAEYIRCDVRDRDQIQALMDGAASRFGGIDILHNNAGVHESDFTDKLDIESLPEDVWERVYEINLRAVWLCTRAAAPYLRKSERGPAIVNAASSGGVTGYPMASAYCATKGAVIQLTKTTAIDLAPTVRCNCYCPAAVDTPMIRKYFDAAEDKGAVEKMLVGSHLIPRVGKPEEVAKLVCFLASDDAAWITGSSYIIDGGSLAWRGTNA